MVPPTHIFCVVNGWVDIVGSELTFTATHELLVFKQEEELESTTPVKQ